MFSGIVESVQPLLNFDKKNGSVQIFVKKPSDFDDIKTGDSIAVNGICLTVESFDEKQIVFTLGAETLKILGDGTDQMLANPVNLERSMRLGDRIHGSLVTGHIEGLGQLLKSLAVGDSWVMQVRLPAPLSQQVWKKGSITLQGVNLTVNEVQDDNIEVCLIPETMKRTNLVALKVGQLVNIETDYFVKIIGQQLKGKGFGYGS
jgi:riboflavin synthase